MTLSTVVPSKSKGELMAKRVVAFMREIGIDKGDITAKTDQETAMLAALSEIARHRAAAGGGRLVPEHSPVGDSKGNGLMERAVQRVEAQIRVARSALEGPVRARLEPDHQVFHWLTEYASVLLTKFEVGKDGKTAYERCKADPRAGVRRSDPVEATSDDRTFGQVDKHMGRRRLPRSQGHER